MMVRKIHVLLIAALSLLLLLVAMPGFAQTATPTPTNEFELTGTVTALTTTTLTINGITIQITSAEINDPISLGTVAKVHYSVDANGVRVAREVEQARVSVISNPGNNNNNNDDDFENEIVGVVSAISGSTVTIDNQIFQISNAEFKTAVMVGTLVKIHYSVAADGTLVAREIEQSLGIGLDDDDRNDDNSDDRNDDRGGSSNSSSNSSNSSNNSSSSNSSNSNSGSSSDDDDHNDDHGGNSGHGSDDDHDDDRGGSSGHGSDDHHNDDRGGDDD